jgi:hypothetical protein
VPRRQLQHGEPTVDFGARIDLRAHRPVSGDQHGIDFLLDPTAEYVDAGNLRLLDHSVGFGEYDRELLVGEHHGFAR